MKIKIVKIIIVITVIIGWMGMTGQAGAVIKKAGNIEVITDEPLFADSIVWYPGLRVEKSFQVKNRGRGAKTVQIEIENEIETKQLAKVLTVQIKEGARDISGVSDSQTLRNFFDSAAITLGEVFGDDSGKAFSLAVTMPAGAGNEYQGARAEFDLRIGFAGDSSSAVTVSAGGTMTAATGAVLAGETGEREGVEGSEGQEGERQSPEGSEGSEGTAGETGGLRELGEVKGAADSMTNRKLLLAMIAVTVVAGALGGWAWRIRKK